MAPTDSEGQKSIEVNLPEVGPVAITREKTRLGIAWCLTILITILSLAFGYRLLFDSTLMPPEYLDTYKTTLALLIGVYGTVMGFYFGSAGQ